MIKEYLLLKPITNYMNNWHSFEAMKYTEWNGSTKKEKQDIEWIIAELAQSLCSYSGNGHWCDKRIEFQ